MNFRPKFVMAAVLFSGILCMNVEAQTAGKEYIRLGGRVIAIENTTQQQQTNVATPTFTPPGGTYGAAQNVTIATTTSGATIHYTTNGSTPTTSSPVYTGPVSVNSSLTLKAIAVKSGMVDSSVASASYVISIVVSGVGVYDDRDSRLAYTGVWQGN